VSFRAGKRRLISPGGGCRVASRALGRDCGPQDCRLTPLTVKTVEPPRWRGKRLVTTEKAQ
jgi:hypothetical protein